MYPQCEMFTEIETCIYVVITTRDPSFYELGENQHVVAVTMGGHRQIARHIPASCITFLSEQAFAPQNTRSWSRSRVWFQFTVGEDKPPMLSVDNRGKGRIEHGLFCEAFATSERWRPGHNNVPRFMQQSGIAFVCLQDR